MQTVLRRLLLVYILVVATVFAVQAQKIKFRHLKVEDGLVHGWIRHIYKDSYGYMWFGTGNNGLNKYDGSNFTVYENDPENINSISSNSISIIYEDINQNLWIGTYYGLNVYNRELDIVNPIPSLNIYVNDIVELDNGKFYFVTQNGLLLYDQKNDSITPLNNLNENLTFEFIREGIVKYNNKFLIGTNNGLFHFDTTEYRLTPVIKDINIRSITIDAHNRIWCGTQNKGLFCMLFRNENFSDPVIKNFVHNPDDENSISEGSIVVLQIDNNNNLWIGTENDGLNILNLNNLNKESIIFQHYRNNPNDIYTISHNSINSIFTDNEGTVWISTYNSGISYYNKFLTKFNHIKYEQNNNNSINDNQVNAIFQEDQYLWIGTQKGLNVQNLKTNKWEHFEYDENDNKSLGAKAVCAIYRDSRNNMWIGTWAGGLNLFNENTKTFTRFIHDPNDKSSISNNNIFDIDEDESGIIWIATMGGGLNKFDYKTNSFKSYNNDWIKALLIINNDEIWLATSTGLQIFNKDKEEFFRFLSDPDDKKSISSNNVQTIFEDSKKKIWMGTDNGLNLFYRDSLNFKLYNKKDGLPNNVIRGICEDEHGNLWISTNKGLSKFINGIHYPQSPVFENYDIEDGLQGNEFNSRSYFKDKEGRLYFGGTNGFNIFNPDSIKKNPHLPDIVFTNLLIFNKPVKIGEEKSPLTKHISLTEELTFNHHQSVITIEYAAFNYLVPDKTLYAYIMEGFEKEWNYVGAKRTATYTNLDPGKYNFRVKAANNDGIWNEEGVSLQITILPPWWKTFLFRVFVVIFFISFIIAFYYYRISQLNRQKRILQELVKKRTREIEEKNTILVQQTNELNETNTILEERQQRIEEQAEELKTQAEKLSKTNEALVTSNATKDKFFSIIAHDLKNPFSSILGFCEVLNLRYDKYDDTKRKHLVGVIERSAQNVFRLLENLLQWSRSQTGNIKYSPEEFSVNEIVESIITLIDNSLTEKGLKFTYNIPDDLTIYADKNMIYTVIRNLVTNAIKFTELGEIQLKALDVDSYTKISVIDTGIGIRKEVLEKIFEIEKSKSSEGTRGEPGTGLGLIICKEFVEKNGGEIGVESEVGKGSTFYFTIPKHKK